VRKLCNRPAQRIGRIGRVEQAIDLRDEIGEDVRHDGQNMTSHAENGRPARRPALQSSGTARSTISLRRGGAHGRRQMYTRYVTDLVHSAPSPPFVECSDLPAELTGIVVRQGVRDGVQDRPQLVDIGTAGENPAAILGVEEPVVWLAEQADVGFQRLTGGARPESRALQICDRNTAPRTQARQGADCMARALVSRSANSGR
jgi:hypothetical protein